LIDFRETPRQEYVTKPGKNKNKEKTKEMSSSAAATLSSVAAATTKSMQAATTTSASASSTNELDKYRLPELASLQYAFKLALLHDKPVLTDYWTGSLDKTVLIGMKHDSEEKLLVRNEEEYTSPIEKAFKVGTEFVVMTENSIYMVDAAIPMKRIAHRSS